MRPSVLLMADATINLALGLLLLLFPAGVVEALGVPRAEPAFYPSLLGAVLVGIGIALIVQRRRGSSGLGLLGAIAINLCGGAALAGWLLLGDLELPARGQVFLWALALLLVGISSAELVATAGKGDS
jgi:hypothetical protein